MTSFDSSGSRAVVTASLIVAMELFAATRRMLDAVDEGEEVSVVLGISRHVFEDIHQGRMKVTLEDVNHWIANLVHRHDYPPLEPYASDDSAGDVVVGIEEVLRDC